MVSGFNPLEQKSWIINPNDVEQWTPTETANRCMMFEDSTVDGQIIQTPIHEL